MKFRTIILAISILALPVISAAQEEAQIYVIKKGDTLWGISQRFIKDPYYWPSLWSNNPFVTNPHFIYPGQKVRIYDGRIEILPEYPEPAEVAETPSIAQEPPVVSPVITVKAQGNGPGGFISQDEIESAGILVDTVDNRIMMATGDKVFVDLKNIAGVQPGQRFGLFHVGDPVDHPITGEKIGNLTTELGSLQITEIHPDVATAVITSAEKEIERGALLGPWEPRQKEIALKKAQDELTGYIVSGGQGQVALSQFDYIYLDLGAQDGLETGNLLYISRPRQATEHGLEGQDIQLPEILLGTAVVVDTQLTTATALILKATNQPIQRGDQVSTYE